MTIKFVKQDCWVGLHWHTEWELVGRWVDYYNYQLFTKRTWYLCLIPCFPIIWTTHQKEKS